MCLLFLTNPSFLLGHLGTFALVTLSTLRWGTLFIVMKKYFLEILNRVLTKLGLYMPLAGIEDVVCRGLIAT